MLLQSLATLLSLILAFNYWGWHSSALATVLGLGYLALVAYLIGNRVSPNIPHVFERLAWGLLISLLIVSVVGTLAFYIQAYTTWVTFGLACVLPWFGRSRLGPTHQQNPEAAEKNHEHRNHRYVVYVAVAYLALIAITLVLLIASRTDEAIRTPWAVIVPITFVAYALSCTCLIYLAHMVKSQLWLVPFYLLSLSVLGLTYSLQFGFDPFIHQASERLLNLTGTLTPKPLYYAGQYTLVVFLHQLSGWPIEQIDKWLLPLVASLGLPLGMSAATRHLEVKQPWHLLLGLTPFGLALYSFTYTTPQGLANLWAVLTIGLAAGRAIGLAQPAWLMWLGALGALASHPLTGLPILAGLALWWVMVEQPPPKPTWRKALRWLTAGAVVFSVPLAFLTLAWLRPSLAPIALTTHFTLNFGRLLESAAQTLPELRRLTELGDLVYLWGRPFKLVLLGISGLGFALARQRLGSWRRWGVISALTFASYLILSLGFTFTSLAQNEQQFYTARLLDLAWLMLMPLTLLGLWRAGEWLRANIQTTIAWVVTLALAVTATWYLSYPRFDLGHRDTAYNTTQADLEAVRFIQADAQNSPYVVLANQAVGAAAIREFGFEPYYQDYFYYPLPTGTNPLYQVYLNATERGLPTHEIVAEAARLTGVPTVYLVLNRYWADFLQLAPVAAREAQARWSLSADRVQIFRYEF